MGGGSSGVGHEEARGKKHCNKKGSSAALVSLKRAVRLQLSLFSTAETLWWFRLDQEPECHL